MWPRNSMQLCRKPPPKVAAVARQLTSAYRIVSITLDAVILVLVVRILLSATGVTGAGPGVALPAMLLLALLSPGPAFLARKKVSRELATVVSRGYMVCPSCGYDLRNLGSPRRCPECGCSYDAQQLRELWEGLRSI